MDFDSDTTYSRWGYATSDARSEPVPQQRPAPTPTVPAATHTPCPPPTPYTPSPPEPTKISEGVYLDENGPVYSKEWPPVLEYLDSVREAKTMLPAPSNLILALAALSVLQHPEDIAHWIFWARETYITVGELVDSIALQKERLIISPVPWIGYREYKIIVNARQEKFTCTVVQRKWYPTESNGAEAHKRLLRSTATDQTEMTANDYFGIIQNEGPSSRRRNGKSAAKRFVQASAPTKRTRRPAAAAAPAPVAHKARGSSSPDPIVPAATTAAPAPISQETTPPPPARASTRVRRKVTPSARSPRIITAAVPDSPEEPETIPPAEPSSMPIVPTSAHARNRSSSAQSASSSTETVVVAERSSSVTSVETAVAAPSPSSPKKRKLDEIVEPEVDDLSKGLEEADVVGVGAEEGMVTRTRASKRIRSGDDTSRESSRMSTPVAGANATVDAPVKKASRSRSRAKRARV
ncbi:hypothetical protein BDN70DRAFT_310947 [Pholiota conissans]|uniref:Uncharacterized protein n=1 Tax=Pholiota conissans TaxID=109636 RepID=A0A9P6CV78_9AGAR|nr:hypothetical protein BDN70DRAFT_310947 [Pholiota conissans]